jgi:glycosyltransferase involved in cell wall biosynthesis
MLHLEQNVLQVGFVADENLPVFMSAAEVYVFASLYEGFGIGPLEAMACGAPVIVSSTSSLPEVVGDAGLQVDPTNQEEIASAMQWVVENRSLREEMRRRSIARAALFSWERTTQQTLDFYRSMLH